MERAATTIKRLLEKKFDAKKAAHELLQTPTTQKALDRARKEFDLDDPEGYTNATTFVTDNIMDAHHGKFTDEEWQEVGDQLTMMVMDIL